MAKGGFRGGSYGGGRGGFSGGGVNMNAIKKMQEEMLKMQTEMEAKTYDATAGGGTDWEAKDDREAGHSPTHRRRWRT